MHQPREIHWIAAITILAYVKSFPRKGLLYRKHEHVRISGYSNFGYTGDKGDKNLPLVLHLYWRKPCDLEE